MIFTKSEFNQATKDEKKEAKQAAREEKKDARQDDRAAAKDERQDAREKKKDAREEKRDDKQDARADKRRELEAIGDGDLKGKDKRDAKQEVRQEKRDEFREARNDKRDEVDHAEAQKDRVIDASEEDKDRRIERAKAEKRRTLDALDIPRAFDRHWKSYLQFQEVDAVEIFQPETLAQLKSILRVAEELSLKVRAIGSGHSFSDIGVTDGFFVETKALNRILPLLPAERRRRFKPEHQEARGSKLVEVEVGIEVYALSKALDEMGLALFNQGTYDGQTLWGVVSTSTHGTGITRRPLPDMVCSVVLVTEGGRAVRVEPSDGVTNPKGWSEPGIDELIQNDDDFYSVICSMGCMGIAYSAIVKTREMYWIDEWAYLTTWEDFKAEFGTNEKLMALLSANEMVSLLVSPITADRKRDKKNVDVENRHPCSILIRRETRERRQIGNTREADIGHFLEDHHFMDWKRPHDSQFAVLPKLFKGLSHQAVYNYGTSKWQGAEAEQVELAPDRRNKCYEIFPQGGKIFGGFASELAFDRKDTFRILDRIIELAEDSRDDGDQHSAPIAVRWVAPSKAYASPQYQRDTVMFEVLMTKGTSRGKEMVEKIERALLQEEASPSVDPARIMRLHWGLQMGLMENALPQLRRMFPKWDRWMNTYARFNAKGTFNNRFTDRLGISTPGPGSTRR